MEQIDALLRQVNMNLKPFHLILASLVLLAGCGPISSSPKTDFAADLDMPTSPQATSIQTAANRPQTTPADVIARNEAISEVNEAIPAGDEAIPAVKETPASQPGAQLDPAGQRLLELARADLASRLGIPEDEIELVALQAVTWPDASLGCPQPDLFYIQILSPGYRIILAVGDQRYRYHTDLSETFLLCEQNSETLPQIPIIPGEIQDGKPWMPVQ